MNEGQTFYQEGGDRPRPRQKQEIVILDRNPNDFCFTEAHVILVLLWILMVNAFCIASCVIKISDASEEVKES
jgi:hypothetical protein